MQTFLPLPDFRQSVQVLDYRRLGKQRVEAWQIYTTITQGSRWRNHPAVKMWSNHVPALLHYGAECCKEWINREYRDNMLPGFSALLVPDYDIPPWFGNPLFHSSHRAALLQKDYNWYSQYKWVEEPGINYYWPEELQ